ncbi:MAG: flavodoxin family protein, partial [Kiritimatiellia bacterium]
MKTLVVFYSRTGHTRKVAEKLAGLLGAETEELIESGKDRAGVLGFMKAGRDAMLKRAVELASVTKDPASFDLVVLGSPVWAFTMCPAIRAYAAGHAGAIRKAAFFCTHGGGGASKSFTEAEAILGKPLAATLALVDKAVDRGEVDADLA